MLALAELLKKICLPQRTCSLERSIYLLLRVSATFQSSTTVSEAKATVVTPLRFYAKAKLLARMVCLSLLVLVLPAQAQQHLQLQSAVPAASSALETRQESNILLQEFTFARLVYDGAGWGDWPRWQADWPEAETHFLAGLRRLTRLDAGSEGVLVNLESDELYDYPWLYAVEVGALELSRLEAERLREYLLRGGFLMVDDFHGISQWQQFQSTIQRVFPDRHIEELDSTQLFSVLFDVGESLQIPGIRPLMANRTWEYGGTVPRWRVIRDEQQRVMVAINFNMDLGDAWEHADDARYPQRYSALAYRIGTNYVLYALTH